ncbi:MAG: hypothetical protein ACTSP3_10830, partial [Candidatus Heimdallarchaeaceae archaeon]
VQEVQAVKELTEEQILRREEIIKQMLEEAKKREEDITVRDLGETEGKLYSAVVFGQESSRNIRKWKKFEKARLKAEKRKAKRKSKKKQK